MTGGRCTIVATIGDVVLLTLLQVFSFLPVVYTGNTMMLMRSEFRRIFFAEEYYTCKSNQNEEDIE